FALFFLIFGIGACFGWETGYAINLARDFGPRLVTYMIGYGHEVWSAGGYYFWVPMVAPFLGTAFGGFLYDMFIYTGHSPVNSP
ncbi:aquaporin, partial [Vibrio parahaemolyticus]|nr:aquaporin [Vibrio parahaemolyticus]